MEIGKHPTVYMSLVGIIRELCNHTSLLSLLGPLPDQNTSIQAILANLEPQAAIMINRIGCWYWSKINKFILRIFYPTLFEGFLISYWTLQAWSWFFFLCIGKASANGSVPKEKGGKAASKKEEKTTGGDTLAKQFQMLSEEVGPWIRIVCTEKLKKKVNQFWNPQWNEKKNSALFRFNNKWFIHWTWNYMITFPQIFKNYLE